ncbi:MAG: hypothetical protein GF330_13030, partial [Candidatus Eisenbacteria bacterium]|nr:hypothetical protein [Candidatus Eisenbacteria bacterium]
MPIWIALLLLLIRPSVGLQPMREMPAVGAVWIFYFLVQGASILFSQNPLRSLICLRGDWPVLFLPIFLGILQVPRARRWGLAALGVSAALSGLLGLWQHATGSDPLGRSLLEPDAAGRFLAVGSLRGHLTYAGTLMTVCAAAFGLAISRSGRPRLLWLVTGLATGAGLLASYSRSAWLGAVAGGLLLWILAWRARGEIHLPGGRRSLLAGAWLVAAAALLVFAVTPGLRGRFLEMADVGSLPRLRLWATALRIFADFPVFGAGLGEWKELFPLYRVDFPYMATGHPHSDLLNVLVHSGFAGGLAFVSLWVALGRRLARGARGAGPALWGGPVLATFLVAGLAQCYFTDEEPAGVFWVLLAAALSEGTARHRARRSGSAPGRSPAPPSSPRPSLGRRLERGLKARLLP